MSEAVEISNPPATILFVDDEVNILSSLKRLFRPFGYRIFTAEGGAQGLEMLARERVDLVVSDMRMPEMNGAQFLEQVRERWPETVRILLTGYAEIGATIDAINKGEIYRYISKPWEDDDILLTVKQALQQKRLEREKQHLDELTHNKDDVLPDELCKVCAATYNSSELTSRSGQVKPGMVLSRDLMTPGAERLLSKGQLPDEQIFDQIRGANAERVIRSCPAFKPDE